MKKLLTVIGLLFACSSLKAAVTYTIDSSTFTMDVNQGTFVVSGSTFGAIVGVQYTIRAVDGVTGAVCFSGATINVSPRLSFPTAPQMRNFIMQDTTDSDAKNVLLRCLAERNTPAAKKESRVSNNVAGVDGSVINPP